MPSCNEWTLDNWSHDFDKSLDNLGADSDYLFRSATENIQQ